MAPVSCGYSVRLGAARKYAGASASRVHVRGGLRANDHSAALNRGSTCMRADRAGVYADELGAAMYPPQDEEQMRAATDAILKAADGIRIHSQRFEVDHEVTHACGEPFQ